MSMENVIKEKTEEIVLKYKLAMKANGGEFSALHEDLLRQGISYGISFAAIALASAPVDIALKTADVKTEEKKLPSYEEYKNKEKEITLSIDNYSEPLFDCPACGGGVCRNNNIILTSNPPQNQYLCNKCGKVFRF